MAISAVLFDAFGTLLKIQNARNPYRLLLKIGISQGRRPLLDDAAVLLSNPLDMRGAAERFGISADHSQMVELENLLQAEIAGIEPYQDALEAVQILQAAGIIVGICSNLAMPYAEAVERLFPTVRLHAYSFSVGAIKPACEIYRFSAAMLGTPSVSNIAMIGDSLRCDRDGARASGINGWWLNRDGGGDYRCLVSFAADCLS